MYGRLFFWNFVVGGHRSSAIVLLVASFLLVTGEVGLVSAEVRHHEAHVHGIGNLNVALDGNDLMLELASPAANIVGFEHAPENEQQEQEVHKAIGLLKDGEKLFLFSSKAECKLHDVKIDNDMAVTHQEEHGDHHEAHETHHEKHEDHHDHGHSYSEKDHHEESAHSDFAVEYHFKCGNPESLKSIDVQLFFHFPGFEHIEVQLLTAKQQTAVELSHKNSQIPL